MKGDFSYLHFDPANDDTGVLHQQGRVLLDRDWNADEAIDRHLRTIAAEDSFGPGVLAVPAASPNAFKVVAARFDGTSVFVDLLAGRAWASGVPVSLAVPTTLFATYLEPPLAPLPTTPIGAGVRDAVLLEVWEDTVNGFQQPADLIEPALGGPDTTERLRAFAVARLLRLGPNDDCAAVGRLNDDFDAKGKLTVSPAPVLAIGGDCPLEAGGGYTGLEHYLYRVEIADPLAGEARFKWSQFNGGLVGRGLFTPGAPGTGSVNVLSNDQQIDLCGLSAFYLEALKFDAELGAWRIVFTADATLTGNGVLGLTKVQGVWPALAPATGFFRLWNGIANVADFPAGTPTELKDGIRLEFEAPAADLSNYRPGDYWKFPVRASGAAFAPPVWPLNAPPHGVVYRRVALAEINWNAAQTASFDAGEIEDCRHIFRPLTNQKICCTYNVGDGATSFGDFNSIEEALRHLPAAGGEICLLPGLHNTNTLIRDRQHVTIRGCGVRTKLTPRQRTPDQPIFAIVDSHDIELLHMDMFTLGGSAIVIDGSKPGAARDIEVAQNRILACDNAVRARNAAGLWVHHNRIRMLDKRGSGVAIFLAGDDSLIERNDIRLLPFVDTPPIDVPDDDGPIEPTDPCARLERTFVNPRIFLRYVDVVWAVAVPLFPLFVIAAQPYRALGGIQLGGGCERVKVIENTIVGGAGNGITLGAASTVAPPPPAEDFVIELTDPDGRIAGMVLGPDGRPLAGVQITLTNTAAGGFSPPPQVSNTSGQFSMSFARGNYRVTEGAPGLEIDGVTATRLQNAFWTLEVRLRAETAPPPADEEGFLYDIGIERNTVSAMGLSGIGVPTLAAYQGPPPSPSFTSSRVTSLAAARAQLGNPVVGLVIRGNTLTGNLRNPFDNSLRAEAAVRGVGGISLGLVDDALIDGNRIEKNGRSTIDPLCGIFIQYGEDVDVHHNQVLEHGVVPGTNDELAAGKRGGIVLDLVSSFSMLAALGERAGAERGIGTRPAARVCDNSVTQPAGCALSIRAYGPLQIHDNSFSSEFAGLADFERIGGTVLIHNLGGVQSAPPGMDVRRPGSLAAADVAAPAPAPAPGTSTVAVTSRARLQPVSVAVSRAAAAASVLPPGNTMFNDNQSRTGATNRALGCHLLICADDLSYQDNQSYSFQAQQVYANALLMGDTVRACGNRLRETFAKTMMSMLSLGIRANDSSFNQGDHCIIVTDSNPAMPEVQLGNQVLNPGGLCGRINMTAALLFKPIG